MHEFGNLSMLYYGFYFFNVILLIATCAGSYIASMDQLPSREWAIVLTACWLWLILVISYYTAKMAGFKYILSLSPLICSLESRQFVKQLRSRNVITDQKFIEMHYGSITSHHFSTIVYIRSYLRTRFSLADRIIPTDNLEFLDDEFDLGELLRSVSRHLGLSYVRSNYINFDGTLGSLIIIACQLADSASSS